MCTDKVVRFTGCVIGCILVFPLLVTFSDGFYLFLHSLLLAYGLWAVRSVIVHSMLLKALKEQLSTRLQHLLNLGDILSHIHSHQLPNETGSPLALELHPVPVSGTRWQQLLSKVKRYKVNPIVRRLQKNKRHPKDECLKMATEVFLKLGKDVDSGFLKSSDFSSILPAHIAIANRKEFDTSPSQLFDELMEGYGSKMSRKRLAKAFFVYFTKYENFIKTVSNMDSLGGLLYTASVVVFGICFVVSCFVVFGDTLTDAMLPFFTLLLSVSFVCGNTFKTLLESCIYIFITRPFEGLDALWFGMSVAGFCSRDVALHFSISVGDRVDVSGFEKYRFRVVKIGLQTTSFLDEGSNQRSIIANHILATRVLTNLSRSQNAKFRFEINMGYAVASKSIAKFIPRVKHYCVLNNKDWKPDPTLLVKEFSVGTSCTVLLIVTSQHGWYADGPLWERLSEMTDYIRNLLLGLKIQVFNTIQPVRLLNAPEGAEAAQQAKNETE